MAEVGVAFLTVVPSMKNFGSQMSSQLGPQMNAAGASSGKKFGGAFGGSAGTAVKAVGLVGLMDVAVRGITGSVSSAREAQKIAATTNALIKATGGVAKVTTKDVDGLTAALMRKTGIDDDQIRVGANILLTFKNIRNEVGAGNRVFDRATQAALDLSSVKGFGGLEGASVSLGKALNDPVAGITALNRKGVQFTAQQKAQVKALVESGEKLAAQKIILKEVEEQVGGTAAEQSTNVGLLTAAIGELAESAGGNTTTKLDGLAANLLKLSPAIEKFQGVASENPGLLDWVEQTVIGMAPMGPAVNALTSDLSADFATMKKSASTNLGSVRASVTSAWRTAKSETSSSWASIRTTVSSRIGDVVSLSKGMPGRIRSAVGNLGGLLKGAGTALMDGFRDAIRSKFSDIQSTLSDLTAKLPDWKGPLSLDRVILYDSGVAVMGGFVNGLDSQRGAVRGSLRALTSDLAVNARVSARTSAGVSGASSTASDRPIYTDSGVLFGWLRQVANGEARLVFNEANFEMGVYA